jgi:hypothetical protein
MANNIGRPSAILGTDAAIEQGTKLRWNIHTGETQVRTFKGPADKVHALYQTYKAFTADVPQFDDLSFDAGRGVGILEAVKSQELLINGVPSSTVNAEPRWELLTVEERVAVEFSPAFSAFTTAQLKAVRDAYLHNTAQDPAWAGDARGDLYALYMRGVTDYPDYMYVARVTYVTTKRSTITASFDGVGVASTLSPAVTNPLFIAIKQKSIDWLKRPPCVREIERHRWEIQQEWWGIEFDTSDGAFGRVGWSAALFGGRASP